jgi:hypothetical protein
MIPKHLRGVLPNLSVNADVLAAGSRRPLVRRLPLR